jgi:hypothetical protein
MPPKTEEPKTAEREGSDPHAVYQAEVHAAVDTVEGLSDEQRGAVHAAVEAGLTSAQAKCTAMEGAPAEAAVEASGDVEALRAERDAAVQRAVTAERTALVMRGRAEKKLTPALEKLYATKSPAELEAFLKAAQPIAALERTAARTQATGDALPGGVAGVPDAPFEKLTPHQKHQLLRANPLAFEQRLAAYEARAGEQPKYRAMLG